MGSWATTQPPGADGCGHAGEDGRRVEHVQQEEATEGEVDRLGQTQVLTGLGDGQHLAVRRCRLGHLVTGQRVAVDGVDPSLPPDDLGQGHRHVAAAGPHVGTDPARADAEAVEGSGQGSAVDVVA